MHNKLYESLGHYIEWKSQSQNLINNIIYFIEHSLTENIAEMHNRLIAAHNQRSDSST